MLSIKPLLRICLALICYLPVIGFADQTDRRLAALFDTLRSSQDALVLVQTEAEIWDIWYQSGSEEVDALMLEAAGLVRGGDLAAAESLYTEVTERLPKFSEGWNRRATVRFYQRDYAGSLEGTPVFLGCSDVDAHIPLARVHETGAVLQRLGGQVDTRIYPGMGHTINQDELDAVRALLREVG